MSGTVHIVGAGLGGLSAAVELSDAGYKDIRFYEAAKAAGGRCRSFVDTVLNIVVDNVPMAVGGQIRWTTIDLSADSAVIWTDVDQAEDLAQEFNLGPDTPFRVYLEGNIVVRQDFNEAKATHAYYDISERRGLLMNAEVRAYVPALQSWG